MGACGIPAFSRNFLTRGASGKETTRPRALAPAGPSVPAVSSWLRRLFRLFFAPVCALLSAGSRPALTQARRLRACPAGLSYAHGCRLGYELRRTPSADSPAVGKGGPLGPGCLIPAAAKPGGGHQSGADARIPGRAAEPLRASWGLLGPSGAALEENEVLTLTKPGNILNVAKEW